jgi:autotransporter translocation and assembly factor TamB
LDARGWLAEAGPYLGARQDLKVVTFDRLDHAFRLEEERYHVARLDLVGGPTEWGGAGWIDLAGSMDLDLRVRLPVGFTPDLGALSFMAEGLRDEERRVNLAFSLRGPTARPAFAVDLGNLTGRARRSDDSAAVGEIENGLGGLLDKWRGR